MRKPSDFDAQITRDADPDDTGAIDTQALEQAARVALERVQRHQGGQGSDPQYVVREMFPEILYCLVGGYTLRDIHAALIELTIFKGTLATFRRHVALERKRHPRLSPTVQDRILADFHNREASAHRRYLH